MWETVVHLDLATFSVNQVSIVYIFKECLVKSVTNFPFMQDELNTTFATLLFMYTYKI